MTININKITYLLLYVMLFSPILSYLTFGVLGLRNTTYYFTFISFFYGVVFMYIKRNTLYVPKFLYLILLYSIYQTIWSFFNGKVEERGIVQVLINREIISVFFIIVIIYNTHFSQRFINTSIFLIKLTVISAFIASLMQVYDSSFLDASALWLKDRGSFELGDVYLDRRVSIFGYINLTALGLSFMPLLSILIATMLQKKEKLTYIFLIMGGVTAFLSNARYVMVSFVLVSFNIFFSKDNKLTSLVKYIYSVALFAVIVIPLFKYFGYDLLEWFNLRLFSEGSIENTTRYQAYFTFLMFFPKHPFVGYGGVTDRMTWASHAIGSSQIHVGYLAHLAYYGIFGSILLFGFWFILAKRFYKTAKVTNYWGSFFGFLIFLWANATLVYFSIFLYGIIFTLVFDKYNRDIYQKKLMII